MKKQFLCNHTCNSCGNSQFEPQYNCTHSRPHENYTLEDEFLDYKSSEAYSSNISSHTQDKGSLIDDYPWKTISCLKQKACRFVKSDSEYTSAVSEYTYHSQELQFENCSHNLNFLKKAKELMDYDPESIFLKKMKEQYVQQNQPIVFPSLTQNRSSNYLPYACQHCLSKVKEIVKIGEDLSQRLTKSCICQPGGDNNNERRNIVGPVEGRVTRDKISPPMRSRSNPISRRQMSPESGQLSRSQSHSRGENKKKKSQHISRSKKPGRCKGRRVRKSDGSIKCQSQDYFEPTLKRPHENSCERCWRYASPPRSPVNKPEQRYEPNFRKGHSVSGDGGGDENLKKEIPEAQASPRSNFVRSDITKRMVDLPEPPHKYQEMYKEWQEPPYQQRPKRDHQQMFQESQQRHQPNWNLHQSQTQGEQLHMTPMSYEPQRQPQQPMFQGYQQQMQPIMPQDRYQQQMHPMMPPDRQQQMQPIMPQDRYQQQMRPMMPPDRQQQMHPMMPPDRQQQRQKPVQQWHQQRQQRQMQEQQQHSPTSTEFRSILDEYSHTQAKSRVALNDEKVHLSQSRRSHYPSGLNETENLTYNDFVDGLDETDYLQIKQPSQPSVVSSRSPLKDLNTSSREKYSAPKLHKVSSKINDVRSKTESSLYVENSNLAPKSPKKKVNLSPKSSRRNAGSKSPTRTGKVDFNKPVNTSKNSDVGEPKVFTTRAEIHKPPRSKTPSPRKPGNVSKSKIRRKEKKQLSRTPSPDIQVIEEGAWISNSQLPEVKDPQSPQKTSRQAKETYFPAKSALNEPSPPANVPDTHRKRYFNCNCAANRNYHDPELDCLGSKSTYFTVYEGACPCSGRSPPRLQIPCINCARSSVGPFVQCPYLPSASERVFFPNQNQTGNTGYLVKKDTQWMSRRTGSPGDQRPVVSNQNMSRNSGYQAKENTQWVTMRGGSSGERTPVVSNQNTIGNIGYQTNENTQWMPIRDSSPGDQRPIVSNQNMSGNSGYQARENTQWMSIRDRSPGDQRPIVSNQNMSGNSGYQARENMQWVTMRGGSSGEQTPVVSNQNTIGNIGYQTNENTQWMSICDRSPGDQRPIVSNENMPYQAKVDTQWKSMHGVSIEDQRPFVSNRNMTGNGGYLVKEDPQWMSMRDRSPEYQRPFVSNQYAPGNMGYSTKEDTQWVSMRGRSPEYQRPFVSNLNRPGNVGYLVKEDSQWMSMRGRSPEYQRPFVSNQNMPGNGGYLVKDDTQWMSMRSGSPGNQRANVSYRDLPENVAENTQYTSVYNRSNIGNPGEESIKWTTMHGRPTSMGLRSNVTLQNMSCHTRNPFRESEPSDPSKIKQLHFSTPNFPVYKGNPNEGITQSAMDNHVCMGQQQDSLFGSPRRYYVFYMTKNKESEKNDVEVLVEEFGTKREQKKDNKEQDLKAKMKKVLDSKSDSMALRFQKGVPCRNPPSSRTLYF